MALHDMLEGMGGWVDAMVAFIISLPLIAVWVVTILFAMTVAWRLGRRIWRLILPGLPGPHPAAASASAPPRAE